MKIQLQTSNLIIFESALFRTTTTLLRSDNYILLIDPNWLPIEIEFIARWTEEWGSGKEKYLLFTHSDYDHIIGYGRFLDYRVLASLNFVNNNAQEKILKQIIDFDDEYYITRDYEISYPKVQLVVRSEQERWRIGNEDYLFYQAPGHNPDGILIYNRTQGVLIVGDYLSNIEFPYIYDSLEGYKNSLRQLTAIVERESINILITGHGDHTNSKAEMELRLKESFAYIEYLEQTVENDSEFDLEELFERYKFPQIMTRFHQGNVRLARQELKLKK